MAAPPPMPESWEGGLVVTVSTLLPGMVPYFALQIVTFVPTLFAVRRHYPKHKDPWSLADTLVSLIIFPLLAGSAIISSYKLAGDPELRWNTNIAESNFFMNLYVTRGIFHIVLQCFEDISASHFVLMTLHHILSVVCYCQGLYRGRLHFFGCLDGACEMSTIFLNNLYLSKEVTINGKELKELLPSWVYALNGICLWLSFLVFRICLFPTWLYVMYTDAHSFPATTWDKSSWVERYAYPGVTLFLLSLSSYWFVPITKGMLKALGIIKKPRKDQD